MTDLPANYDAWRLTPPDAEGNAIGEEEGDTCNRYHEPDEDGPRGYKPAPCQGTMRDVDEYGVCDTCGAMA